MASMELVLRDAQATTALAKLRHGIGLRTQLRKFRPIPNNSVASRSRGRTAVDNVQANIASFAASYRRARAAYSKLNPPAGWEARLKPLEDADIRPLGEHQDGKMMDPRLGTGQGSYRVSWIHMNPITEEELLDGMLCCFQAMNMYG